MAIKKFSVISSILIFIGILPHFLSILSQLTIFVGSALGICAPHEDLYSGPLCDLSSTYNLIYYIVISNNPNLLVPFLTILLLGVVLSSISYIKRKKAGLYISKISKFFMIIGLIGVIFSSVFFLPAIYRHNFSPGISGCSVYLPITGPNYELSVEDEQLIQYKKRRGCDDVLVKILYCRTYADDPNNLSAIEQKNVDWLKQKCSDNDKDVDIYARYKYVQIWPNCVVYSIYSDIYSNNPEEFPEVTEQIDSFKKNGCKNVYLKPRDQLYEEIKEIEIHVTTEGKGRNIEELLVE